MDIYECIVSSSNQKFEREAAGSSSEEDTKENGDSLCNSSKTESRETLYLPQKRSWTEAGELANLYEQMLLLTHVTTSKVSSKFINTKVII